MAARLAGRCLPLRRSNVGLLIPPHRLFPSSQGLPVLYIVTPFRLWQVPRLPTPTEWHVIDIRTCGRCLRPILYHSEFRTAGCAPASPRHVDLGLFLESRI